MSLTHLALRLLPAPLIRALGRLQFKVPLLRGVINYFGQSLSGEGVIQRGAGKGLRFNAQGCNPGYLAGTSVPVEQALLVKYAQPGSVVYELGANAGFYAIIAARSVGAAGRVYAFEPTPTLAGRIRENASINGFAHVEVVEAAVSNIDGEIRFGVEGPLSVSNSIHAEASSDFISVESIRLDTFCANRPPPCLILIDIEGAEIDALRGALQTIARHRPVIMVEVHWLGPAFIDFFNCDLKPLGYTATTYEGAPLSPEFERYHALLLPSR